MAGDVNEGYESIDSGYAESAFPVGLVAGVAARLGGLGLLLLASLVVTLALVSSA